STVVTHRCRPSSSISIKESTTTTCECANHFSFPVLRKLAAASSHLAQTSSRIAALCRLLISVLLLPLLCSIESSSARHPSLPSARSVGNLPQKKTKCPPIPFAQRQTDRTRVCPSRASSRRRYPARTCCSQCASSSSASRHRPRPRQRQPSHPSAHWPP